MRLIQLSDLQRPIALVEDARQKRILNEAGRIPTFQIDEKAETYADTLFAGDDQEYIHEIVTRFLEGDANQAIIMTPLFRPSEGFTRTLIERGHAHKLAFLGTRGKGAIPQTTGGPGLRCYPMNEIMSEGWHDLSDALMHSVRPAESLMLCVDLMVLDMAYRRTNDMLSAGGMDMRLLLYFVHRLKNMRNLRTIVVTNIEACHENVTAKLLYELLG